MFDKQLMDLIEPFIAKDDIEDPNHVAEVLANETEKFSRNPNYLSPFAKRAKEQFYDYMGGKYDDITIAVAQIKLF